MHVFAVGTIALGLFLKAVEASDACYGGDVVIAPEGAAGRGEYAYGLSASFGGSLPANGPSLLHVLLAEPIDGCQLPGTFKKEYERELLPLEHRLTSMLGMGKPSRTRPRIRAGIAGKILLTSRGNCTFTQKAAEAQAAGAAALLVYSADPGKTPFAVTSAQSGLGLWQQSSIEVTACRLPLDWVQQLPASY